jgi:dTDP-glucose 4,6-dehydratase
MDFRSQLADRPVFVTGADGFVGSHLVDTLSDHGAEVHAFVRATSRAGLTNVDARDDALTLHRGDLGDSHSVRSALAPLAGHSDVLVFHLGAQAHVGESWDRPAETLGTNVLGTVHLLEALVDLDIDVAMLDTAGTSEEYGNVDPDRRDQYAFDGEGRVRLDERAPLNPTSVYATSKVAADFLTMNYHDAYGLPAVTTRMFNNYGPRQSPRYITGTVITQALERDIVELGDLTPHRDMCYVADGVRGHLHAALGGRAGERYVYGSGESVSMRGWAETILGAGASAGHWERPEIRQVDERFRPGDSDVEELRAEYRKLAEATGWSPEVGHETGLERTIRWFANNRPRWEGRVDWR